MPVVEAPDGVVRRRTARRGGFLFVEGDDSTSVVVFAEGRLKLVVTSPDGEHLLLGVLDPPTVLGEIGLIDGGPRSANAEILEDATVLIVPAEEIWRLLRADSAFVEATSRTSPGARGHSPRRPRISSSWTYPVAWRVGGPKPRRASSASGSARAARA